MPAGLELFSVSADAEGRSYVGHPLGASLEVRGDTAWLDLAAHMRRFYAPERSAIAYALVAREGGGIRYLSPGIQHWLRDPADGSGLPGRGISIEWTAGIVLFVVAMLLAIRALRRRASRSSAPHADGRADAAR